MKVTGAQAISLALIEEGVDILFGYPGGAIMPTHDALFTMQSKLRHILVRHEQGAVHAAEGYARVTGKPGVCIVTSGPGATNLVTGIADAMLDSVPLVCITGQVNSHLLGTDAFQEADIVGITVPITKWNQQISRAEDIPEAMAKAFHIANSGRPGPVLLDITKDAQVELCDFHYNKIVSVQDHVAVEDVKIKQAADLINSAQKPFLLVGHGVLISKAEQTLLAFAEKAKLPVASTLLGLSAFPVDHPLYTGMLGMHGNYAPNVLTNEADLIIAVGMRFDDRVTGDVKRYIPHAKVIHIEIDQAEIDKNIQSTIALQMDAKVALEALMPHLKAHQRQSWLDRFKTYSKQEYEAVIADELSGQHEQIRMAEVIYQLSKMTHGEAILVSDVGQHQMIAARYYQYKKPHSYIASGGLGTMGFALPAAIGAKLGAGDREVIMIAGDGGFQMSIQELAVITQENLPVKMILLNNHFLGMVRQWQELFYEGRYAFTELKNPDFVKVASAYDIPAERVTARAQLNKSLTRLLEAQGPYFLDVHVERQDNVFPMVPPGATASETRLS